MSTRSQVARATPVSRLPVATGTKTRVRRTEPTETLDLTPVKIESAPLRQKIVTSLRRAIELGVLKAGDRLIEKDLCTKLNVSRTSLREALRDLEASDVVRALMARGLVVTSLSKQDIININMVRGSVETMLAEQFIKLATEQEAADLKAAQARLKSSMGSASATLAAYQTYYEAWCQGARNSYAHDLVRNIQLRLSVTRSSYLTPEFLRNSVAGREEISNCMVQRNVAGARAAVRKHVNYITDVALAAHKGD
jgi:DNA-binding GntR family transcriptional regulator